jgi:hypothetical protein
MGSHRYRALKVLLLASLVISVGFRVGEAVAQPQLHVELYQRTTSVPEKVSLAWTGRYSVWEELFPTRGALYSQTDRVDNDENGLLSFNDYIRLRLVGGEQTWYRVQWAGPAYFVTPDGGGDQRAFEAIVQNPPPSGPVGESWRPIIPTYGSLVTVTGWDDLDSSGVADAGDQVTVGGTTYVIDRVGLGMILVEAEPIEEEARTWGAVKSLY